jgi:hypothetical protein
MGFRSALTIRVPRYVCTLLTSCSSSSILLYPSIVLAKVHVVVHIVEFRLSHLISTAAIRFSPSLSARKTPIGHVQSRGAFSEPQARVADASKAKL